MSPELGRRHFLGGAAVTGAAVFGVRRLRSGAVDAAFESWEPAPGTWPLQRYDPGNTAHNPHANPPRESPTSRVLVDRDAGYVPLVGTDHLVLAGGDGLSVHPRDGGDAVWTSERSGIAGFGPPEDNRLYAITRTENEDDYQLLGVATDGEVRQVFETPYEGDFPLDLLVGRHELYASRIEWTSGGHTGSRRRWRVAGGYPALADGRLYTIDDPRLTAYEEREGLNRHLERGPRQVWRVTAPDGRYDFYGAAVADGRLVTGVYYHFDSPDLVAGYDAETGDPLWEPREVGMFGTPTLAGDRGYTVDNSGRITALDLATGETIWRDEVEWSTIAAAVGGEDTVVVTGGVTEQWGNEMVSGNVRAYDAATGDVLWTVTLDAGPGFPVLVENQVLVAAGGTLHEFRA